MSAVECPNFQGSLLLSAYHYLFFLSILDFDEFLVKKKNPGINQGFSLVLVIFILAALAAVKIPLGTANLVWQNAVGVFAAVSFNRLKRSTLLLAVDRGRKVETNIVASQPGELGKPDLYIVADCKQVTITKKPG